MAVNRKRDEFVEARLAAIDMPLAYQQFIPTKGHPVPDPPYVIYYVTEEAGGADALNLFVRRHVSVELYTDFPDAAKEAAIEACLGDVQWTKTEDYIESEHLNMVSYEFDYFKKIRRS